MRPWHRKAVASNAKALIPFRGQLRSIYRRMRPYETDLPTNDKLFTDALTLVRFARESAGDLGGSAVLELGTGWVPVTTLLFSLTNPARIVLTDQERLLDARTFDCASALLRNRAAEIATALALAPAAVETALCPAAEHWSLENRLKARAMQYHVPFDFASAPSASFDVIVSRAVLEHVRPDFLDTFARESMRLLRPGGVFCHIIDHSDHWEHSDKSISRVNFLQYPNWLFRLTHINPQDYQNRWRHSDYVQLFVRGGFQIVRETRQVDDASKAALTSMPLAPQFAGRDIDDLATIQSLIVARRPA